MPFLAMAPVERCLRLLRVRLVALVLLFFSNRNAAAKKTVVTIDSGATIMQASSLDLSTFDAFDSLYDEFSAMSLSQDSGCTLGGLSLKYIFPSMALETPALVVDVDLTSTTVTAETSIQFGLSEQRLGDLVGTKGNQHFLNIVCRAPAIFIFPKACAFFNPSNLAKQCFYFAPLKQSSEGRSFGSLFEDDPFIISTNNLQLLHSDLRFNLQIARGNPCRTSGVSLRYVFSDLVSALEVDVTADSATIWANTMMARAFTTLGLGDLLGEHTIRNFLSIVCRRASKQVLPKACDFFAPSHLGMVCSALSPLLWEKAEVRDFNYRLTDTALPVDEDPFMLRPELSTGYTPSGKQLGLFQTARESPCTDAGLRLRYFQKDAKLALDVVVRPEETTATASSAFSLALREAGMIDMVGTHNIIDFRAKLCRKQGKHLFPFACDFFAPQHLGSVCESLSYLLQESAQAYLQNSE